MRGETPGGGDMAAVLGVLYAHTEGHGRDCSCGWFNQDSDWEEYQDHIAAQFVPLLDAARAAGRAEVVNEIRGDVDRPAPTLPDDIGSLVERLVGLRVGKALGAVRALVPQAKARAAKFEDGMETAGEAALVMLAALAATENRHAEELLAALDGEGA
ncbi:MAG: hypothetical protein JWO46_742 [Nocardioidaceae bacterium]|nr:hypothetical protein [Nocardioidaceae bacterium]